MRGDCTGRFDYTVKKTKNITSKKTHLMLSTVSHFRSSNLEHEGKLVQRLKFVNRSFAESCKTSLKLIHFLFFLLSLKTFDWYH